MPHKVALRSLEGVEMRVPKDVRSTRVNQMRAWLGVSLLSEA